MLIRLLTMQLFTLIKKSFDVVQNILAMMNCFFLVTVVYCADFLSILSELLTRRQGDHWSSSSLANFDSNQTRNSERDGAAVLTALSLSVEIRFDSRGAFSSMVGSWCAWGIFRRWGFMGARRSTVWRDLRSGFHFPC